MCEYTKIQLSGDIDYQGFAELSSGHVFVHLLREDAENLDVREVIIWYLTRSYTALTRAEKMTAFCLNHGTQPMTAGWSMMRLPHLKTGILAGYD